MFLWYPVWILPEPLVALRWPRVRRALGTRMHSDFIQSRVNISMIKTLGCHASSNHLPVTLSIERFYEYKNCLFRSIHAAICILFNNLFSVVYTVCGFSTQPEAHDTRVGQLKDNFWWGRRKTGGLGEKQEAESSTIPLTHTRFQAHIFWIGSRPF